MASIPRPTDNPVRVAHNKKRDAKQESGQEESALLDFFEGEDEALQLQRQQVGTLDRLENLQLSWSEKLGTIAENIENLVTAQNETLEQSKEQSKDKARDSKQSSMFGGGKGNKGSGEGAKVIGQESLEDKLDALKGVFGMIGKTLAAVVVSVGFISGIISGTISSYLKTIGSFWKTIGTGLAKAVGFLGRITGLTTKFTNVVSSISSYVTALTSQFSRVSTWFSKIMTPVGKMLRGLGSIAGKAAHASKLVAGFAKVSPLGPIIMAVRGIYEVIESFMSADTWKGKITGALAGIGSIFTEIPRMLYNWVIQPLLNMIPGIDLPEMPKMEPYMKAALGWFWDLFTKPGETLGKLFGKLRNAVPTAGEIWNGVKSGLGWLGDLLFSAGSFIASLFSGMSGPKKEGLFASIKSAMGPLGSILLNPVGYVSQLFGNIVDGLPVSEEVKKTIRKYNPLNLIKDMFKAITDLIPSIDDIKSSLPSLPSWMGGGDDEEDKNNKNGSNKDSDSWFFWNNNDTKNTQEERTKNRDERLRDSQKPGPNESSGSGKGLNQSNPSSGSPTVIDYSSTNITSTSQTAAIATGPSTSPEAPRGRGAAARKVLEDP